MQTLRRVYKNVVLINQTVSKTLICTHFVAGTKTLICTHFVAGTKTLICTHFVAGTSIMLCVQSSLTQILFYLIHCELFSVGYNCMHVYTYKY